MKFLRSFCKVPLEVLVSAGGMWYSCRQKAVCVKRLQLKEERA